MVPDELFVDGLVYMKIKQWQIPIKISEIRFEGTRTLIYAYKVIDHLKG